MKETPVRFPCGPLTLEGMVALPEGSEPFGAVVVCHPHPLYGGSMDNNVVFAVCRDLVRASLAALRFNFRGTGGSEGEFEDGIGEKEDIGAAISYLASLKEVNKERIGVCGYSFGAGVALSLAPEEPPIRALALISPAVSDFENLKAYTQPKLLLCGTRDPFVPPETITCFQELPEPKSLELIPGADHFWWGYEDSLAAKVVEFFSQALIAGRSQM